MIIFKYALCINRTNLRILTKYKYIRKADGKLEAILRKNKAMINGRSQFQYIYFEDGVAELPLKLLFYPFFFFLLVSECMKRIEMTLPHKSINIIT